MSFRRVSLVTATIMFCLTCVSGNSSVAQESTSYREVEKTIYDQTPVKSSKWIEETVYEKQQVTEYKRVWETEKRERVTKVLKPVTRTLERVEQKKVLRPVTETKYREKETRETVLETVTEMREQDYVVETPIYETEMREERVVVKRPVTEKMIRNDSVTTYRPVVVEEDRLVSANLQFNELVPVANANARPRLKWLKPGYYTDPATGKNVYRNRGLHWVQDPETTCVARTTNVPVLATQKSSQLKYVPETSTQSTPVEFTKMVETVESRKVPVTTKRTQRRIETRKIPVKVERPKTVIRTERIPYQETRYVEETVERRLPITETRYETVERVEPVEVSVQKWVAVTKEIEVPKTVRRKVEVDLIRHTPRRVTVKVPVDEFGNVVEAPASTPPVATSNPASSSKSEWKTVQQSPIEESKKNTRETSLRQPNSILETDSAEPKSSPEDEDSDSEPVVTPFDRQLDSQSQFKEYHARPKLRRLGDSGSEPAGEADENEPQTKLEPVWRPLERETSAEQAESDATLSGEETSQETSSQVRPPSRSVSDIEIDDAAGTELEKSPPPLTGPVTNGPGE